MSGDFISFFRAGRAFSKLVSYVVSFLFLLVIVLVVFSMLSRLGYFNLLGVSIVLTDSMEPVIKPGDMVLYYNANYGVGDVVVYCLTPSHCVTHRVVDFISLDTVSGSRLMVVTKGDNVNTTDSPVSTELVKGKVIIVVPRELWIPLLVVLVTWVFYELLRSLSLMGYAYMIIFLISTISLIAVYATVPRSISPGVTGPPLINLAGVYFDERTCYVRVVYTDELYLSSIEVEVNETSVDSLMVYARELVFKPDPGLLREAFEQWKPLLIRVNASLNRVGFLKGEYTLLISGEDPVIGTSNGALVIRNNNCFPISINISITYPSNGAWYWSNQTMVLDGFSHIMIEPPRGAEQAYVYVYWFNQGVSKWMGLPLR